MFVLLKLQNCFYVFLQNYSNKKIGNRNLVLEQNMEAGEGTGNCEDRGRFFGQLVFRFLSRAVCYILSKQTNHTL